MLWLKTGLLFMSQFYSKLLPGLKGQDLDNPVKPGHLAIQLFVYSIYNYFIDLKSKKLFIKFSRIQLFIICLLWVPFATVVPRHVDREPQAHSITTHLNSKCRSVAILKFCQILNFCHVCSQPFLGTALSVAYFCRNKIIDYSQY